MTPLDKFIQMFEAIILFAAIVALVLFLADRFRGKAADRAAAVGFVLPAVGLLCIGLLYPAVLTLQESFFNRNGKKFVGLDNYATTFTSPELLLVLRNTFIWVLVTPFFAIPDPDAASQAELKFACCPASFVQVSFDNTDGKQAWTGFFALQTSGRWADLGRRTGGDLKGCVSREAMGFATQADVETFIDFNVLSAFDRQHRNPCFLLGGTAGFMVKVPAGEKRRVLVALGYYREGRATFGRPMRYWYTRHFAGIEEVLAYALDNAGAYLSTANERDRELAGAALNAEQKFLIAHATRKHAAKSPLQNR